MNETNEKAKRNDALRRRIPFIIRPDILVLTRGVANLCPDEVARILQCVKDFAVFTPDNDPWREHDFGNFDHDGKTIFWKIDDYDGQEGYRLVLTVMFSDEY